VLAVTAPLIAPERGPTNEWRRAPTFSVVIPVFQAADTIGRAIESALEQTVPPLEVIVCDDGSTDEILEAIAPYAKHIVFLRQENSGPATARNRAVRAARGDIVAFLDADDLFLPPRLERLRDVALARPDLGILTTDAYVDVEGERVGRIYGARSAFPTKGQRTAILRSNFIFVQAAVRRELLLGEPFEALLPAGVEDWYCWISLILRGASAGLLLQPLGVYAVRDASLSSSQATMLTSSLSMFELLERSPLLRPDDREIVSAAVDHHRRELRVTEVRDALSARHRSVRRQALTIAVGRGFDGRRRLRAAVAAVAPAAAARHLTRRHGASQDGRLSLWDVSW
jgi:hypothetical protein